MKKRVNIIFIILLVVLIGALGFFTFKLLNQKEKVLVPDFSNSTQSEVVTWCETLETNPCNFDVDYSDTVPENGVIYQSISADNELGENISFIISLGKKIEITAPKIDEETTKETIDTWVVKNDLANPIEYIEEYSNTVDRTYVIKIEPTVITSTNQTIKVYISKGVKEDSLENVIEVEYQKYLNLSEEEFKTKAKSLKLTPNHNEERDAYSNTIEKGKIVWHGSGTYVEDEKINYGLSLGKKENAGNEIIVKKGDYVGKTLTEFKSLVEELGLVAEHSENYEDSYSDTIAKGSIDWHGSGEYIKGEKIHYTLSLGKKDGSKTDIVVTNKQYVGKTLDEFKKICEDLGLKPEHSEVHSDSYSDTIPKGSIDWHGQGTYVDGEVIHYTLSLGKKDSGSSNKEIIVTKGQYVGLTLDEFKHKCIELGIVAAHSEVYNDDYSDTIAKGSIDWHGKGTYVSGETIHYTLSLGKKEPETPVTPIQPEIRTVTVDSNAYLGKTVDEFKAAMNQLGLTTNYNSSKDVYSSYAVGTICWYNSGSFNEGSSIAYGVSKGKETKHLNGFEMIANQCQSIGNYEGAVTNTKNYFASQGFSNVTCVGAKGGIDDESIGVILSISIDGSTSYQAGNYATDAAIVVTICNELR